MSGKVEQELVLFESVKEKHWYQVAPDSVPEPDLFEYSNE